MVAAKHHLLSRSLVRLCAQRLWLRIPRRLQEQPVMLEA